MRSERGVTMIEILITIVVTAIGLLGLASMQLMNLKNINNTQYRTQATILAYNMAERMRSNKIGVTNHYYGDANGNGKATTSDYSTHDCPSKPSGYCSPAEVAEIDFYEWKELILEDAENGGLPTGAVGTVTAQGSNIYNITIAWEEQIRNSAGGGVETKSLTLAVRI